MIKNWLKDSHLGEVTSKGSLAFVLKVIAAGLGFAVNIMLARMLGVEEVGVYFLAITIVTFLSVIGRVGLDNTVIRFVASYASGEDWKAVKGIYGSSLLIAGIASALLAILVYATAPYLASKVFSIPSLESALRYMSFAIPVIALFTLQAQALQGLKRIADAMIVLSVIVPLASIFLIILLVPEYGMLGACIAFVLATCVSLAVGFWRWNRCAEILQYKSYVFPLVKIFDSCIPLLFVVVMQQIIVWSGNIMLGIWEDSEAVGLFSVANRTAALISFVLIAVNAIAAPKFASLYHNKEYQAVADLARNSTKMMMIMSFPAMLIFVFFPDIVMGLFGEKFISAAHLLTILAFGQFVNVTTGSVGMLLTMTGHEKIWRNNMAIAATASILMSFLFIPWLGATGAAIATALGLSVQMLLAVYLVYRCLGVMTIPIFPQPRLSSRVNNT